MSSLKIIQFKMTKKIDKYLLAYLFVLLIFSYFFLFIKHQVGNDSTISEWVINYAGGFTKRGIVGQIAIEITRIFESNLRWTIFLIQSFVCTIYFILLYYFLRNVEIERTIILSIFTPIFILYPVAEIEVLARKEIIIFSLFLIYLYVPRKNDLKIFALTSFSLLSILVYEPIIFFFPLILIFEIIENKIKKFNIDFLKIILSFSPSLLIASIFIFNPLTENEHNIMSSVLKDEFNQSCYMSCALLKSKSSVYLQFQDNFQHYSFEVFFRYILIILIGSYPLLVLLKNSSLKDQNLIFLKYFKKPFIPFLICLLPVTLLFAMGYDWGRWVNITYVILALIYFRLLINKELILDFVKLKNEFFYKLNKKSFIIFFIIFCLGWNPKTVMTGDVASFPGYRIPYKVIKITLN